LWDLITDNYSWPNFLCGEGDLLDGPEALPLEKEDDFDCDGDRLEEVGVERDEA